MATEPWNFLMLIFFSTTRREKLYLYMFVFDSREIVSMHFQSFQKSIAIHPISHTFTFKRDISLHKIRLTEIMFILETVASLKKFVNSDVGKLILEFIYIRGGQAPWQSEPFFKFRNFSRAAIKYVFKRHAKKVLKFFYRNYIYWKHINNSTKYMYGI